MINLSYRNENDDIRNMEVLYGGTVNGHVRLWINEDVSPGEMGIYHRISAALLRFMPGALAAVVDCWGMRLVQYGTPAQGRGLPHGIIVSSGTCEILSISSSRLYLCHQPATNSIIHKWSSRGALAEDGTRSGAYLRWGLGFHLLRTPESKNEQVP